MSRITSYKQISFIDWESKSAALVFLSGCPWRCPFCHNSSLLELSEGLPKENLFEYLQKKKRWIDGVVITGGEPLFSDDILQLLRDIKNEGFRVKVDTNGSSPDLLKIIIDEKLSDYLALDIKTALKEENYSSATSDPGALNNVLESIELLRSLPEELYEFRTTLIKGIAEEEEVLYNAGRLPAGSLWALQVYNGENALKESMRGLPPLSEKRTVALARELEKRGFKVRIRN